MPISYKISSAKDISKHWPHIEEWVDIARGKDTTYHVDDIKRICENGLVDLWVVFSDEVYLGFLICFVIENPQGKIYHGAWLGGHNLSSWVVDGLKKVIDYAKSCGYNSYSFIGRKAWKKLLGFDYVGEYYYKNLT